MTLNANRYLFYFSDDTITMKKHVMVMKPIAQALDVVQGETNAYLGVLLPTLFICKKKTRSR